MDLAIDQTGVGDRPLLGCRWRGWGLKSVTDLREQASLLASRRCGCIVTAGGRLVAVHGLWWPYHGSLMRVAWDARFASLPADVCELYYHQSSASANFLTLSYVHAGWSTSLTTLYAASLTLDAIAQFRKADAIVCHVTNGRIGDRLLERWGWQAHCLSWRGRHFIKRFYGTYPELPASWRRRLTLEPA